MFSLFSISYLVASVSANPCYETGVTSRIECEDCITCPGRAEALGRGEFDVRNRIAKWNRYNEDAQGLIKTKETDPTRTEIAVLKARVKEVELQLLSKCKP
jgi:hypothetical protein